jgi:hypothetical protein
VVSSGRWIPKIKVKVFPDDTDGDDKWYGKQPCVKLYSDIEGSTIFYSFFEGQHPKETKKYEPGECVLVPEGEWHFVAQAENDNNPKEWKSEKISRDFFVDSSAPEVKIEKPDSRDEISGEVKISATVKDLNLEKFWLIIDDEGGKEILKTKKFKAEKSFSNEKVFVWDTKDVPDGQYLIQLRAVDRFGHENQRNSDGENPPDKIRVRVKNLENPPEEKNQESALEPAESGFFPEVLPQDEILESSEELG